MAQLFTVFKNMQDILGQNSNADPRFEADQLIKFVLGDSRRHLPSFEEIPGRREEKLYSLCERRKEGYPLQYILGEWDFFDMTLKVGEGVLIPRRDTEDVCLAAFDYIKKMVDPTVLDLCAGSGAIALAVKKNCPHANVMAVEKYPKAYDYLVQNIEKIGLPVLPLQRDIFRLDYVIEDDSFDVIISNPPYISPRLQGKLQPEVEKEPPEALFAPDEGLRFYKFIAKYYWHAIKDDGYLIFEHGYDQAERVKQIILQNEYRVVQQITDTAGNPRGIVAQKLRNIHKGILD